MIELRPAQLERFADRTRERFVERMRAYISSTFPERVAGVEHDALRQWVRDGVTRCEAFGVDTEPEAAQLLLLFLVLGLDASERLPWARDILTARDLAPIGKVRLLVRSARARGLDAIEGVLVFEEMAERNVTSPEG